MIYDMQDTNPVIVPKMLRQKNFVGIPLPRVRKTSHQKILKQLGDLTGNRVLSNIYLNIQAFSLLK